MGIVASITAALGGDLAEKVAGEAVVALRVEADIATLAAVAGRHLAGLFELAVHAAKRGLSVVAFHV